MAFFISSCSLLNCTISVCCWAIASTASRKWSGIASRLCWDMFCLLGRALHPTDWYWHGTGSAIHDIWWASIMQRLTFFWQIMQCIFISSQTLRCGPVMSQYSPSLLQWGHWWFRLRHIFWRWSVSFCLCIALPQLFVHGTLSELQFSLWLSRSLSLPAHLHPSFLLLHFVMSSSTSRSVLMSFTVFLSVKRFWQLGHMLHVTVMFSTQDLQKIFPQLLEMCWYASCTGSLQNRHSNLSGGLLTNWCLYPPGALYMKQLQIQ